MAIIFLDLLLLFLFRHLLLSYQFLAHLLNQQLLPLELELLKEIAFAVLGVDEAFAQGHLCRKFEAINLSELLAFMLFLDVLGSLDCLVVL